MKITFIANQEAQTVKLKRGGTMTVNVPYSDSLSFGSRRQTKGVQPHIRSH